LYVFFFAAIIAPMSIRRWLFILLLTVVIAGCNSRSQTAQSNSSTDSQATIDNKGSDTMVNLALAWAERYQGMHPETPISVTGGGTGTGIAALMNNTVDIANASRQIKPEEQAAAEENGFQPVEHVVARDAIAVIVNPQNPIDQLTIQQISDLYSGKINNWKEVGGEDRPVVRLSRETNSGTHVYFLERVLRLGEKDNKTLFATDTLLLPSSQGITEEVKDNPNALGYDGLGYVTPDVKVLAVADVSSTTYILPSAETVNNGSYPIARDLYMYTIGEPEGAIQDYLTWIMQPEAQEIVQSLGFVPILQP
jgi:phosphate transport system substrate-binding protein